MTKDFSKVIRLQDPIKKQHAAAQPITIVVCVANWSHEKKSNNAVWTSGLLRQSTVIISLLHLMKTCKAGCERHVTKRPSSGCVCEQFQYGLHVGNNLTSCTSTYDDQLYRP